MLKEKIIEEMKEVFKEIPFGIEHTPSKIDALDFQIQWEADLLEKLTVMDKQKEQQKIKKCIKDNFKASRGKKIACKRFILD